MNILAIGDLVGDPGVKKLENSIKVGYAPDIVIGGKFKAKGAAFMEGDPNNTGVATENTSISITGGIFSGKEAIKTLNPESDCKNFIYGGKFSNLENEDYIAKGYKAEVAYNGTVEVVKE